ISSSETSSPSCLKQPSSIAAIAGKYEFEIMSGTASFISAFLLHQLLGSERDLQHGAKTALLALDWRVHGDVAAPFVHQPFAQLEIVASHRHFGLALQLARPVAEIIAVPWRLRCKRWQTEPLPDRPRALHELALGQRHRRVGPLERGIDQHRRAFAAIARAARSVAGVLVRHHLEIMLRLA